MGQPKDGRPLGRRRACDFCCRKKIKCDAKSPKCSNCIVHNATCLWTPGVTAPKAGVTKRSAPQPVAKDTATPQWLSAIEHRLIAVESMLGGERILSCPTPPTWQEALMPSPNDSSSLKSTSTFADCVNAPWSVLGAHINEIELWPSAASPNQQEPSPGQHRHPGLQLPPSHIVFPIIKRYFASCNQSIPIFHEATFYTMILEWYRAESPSSPARDQATWAVINAAMGLSLRHSPKDASAAARLGEDRLARECIANAQSVLDSLVTRDEDFKGLQTLLCLSILFMTSPSPKPACVLIATAVKLVHRLRAHTKEGKEGLDAVTALHRDRLFWVTYILDRDLSMKSIEPYIQQDTEYDVDPPGLAIPEDDIGVLASPDGTQKINFFHYRVQLALIQGTLHDTVHSVRARSMSAEKKKAASEKLGCALWEWRCSLPEAFRHENLKSWAEEITNGGPRMLLLLHLTYLLTFFMSFRLHVRDAEWMKQLMDYSERFASEDREPGTKSGNSDALEVRAMLPDHWMTFVDAARTSLDLIRLVDDSDSALIWASTCLFQASLTILIANNLTVSQHRLDEHIQSDMEVIDRGLATLSMRLSEPNLVMTKHATIAELSERSKRAVQAYLAKGSAAEPCLHL